MQPAATIHFGPMSITLLICALQGIVLAALLFRAKRNRAANRALALLILAVAALITPYIIGYAGFYDTWPRLSFAPFSYTLAFGPLIYLYTAGLVGERPPAAWRHFMPVLIQFLAYALVFPLPLATKNWWDGVAHAPVISPMLEAATLVSIPLYSAAAFRRYRAYRRWLDENRTDGIDFDPSWVRNFLVVLAVVAVVWCGFLVANALNPARNYFDQFWLYVLFSLLVIYLGLAGWRHAERQFPRPAPSHPPPLNDNGRDWREQGQAWLADIDQAEHWRDPALTLATLSRRLGTNTAYLSRALNAAAGENFNAIINRRRVACVRRWLESPDEDRDMLSLALDAGFASKASFNRAFSDYVGMSPTAWRLKSQNTA